MWTKGPEAMPFEFGGESSIVLDCLPGVAMEMNHATARRTVRGGGVAVDGFSGEGKRGPRAGGESHDEKILGESSETVLNRDILGASITIQGSP